MSGSLEGDFLGFGSVASATAIEIVLRESDRIYPPIYEREPLLLYSFC